jgi:hypothetical protein
MDWHGTYKQGTALSILEAKNGATGLDNARARKSLCRLLRNKWTGSDGRHLDAADYLVMAREKLRNEILRQREMETVEMDMKVLENI